MASSSTLLKFTPLQWNQPFPHIERHHNGGVLLYPKLQHRSKLIRLQICVRYNQSTSPDPDLRSATNPFERIAIQVKKALGSLKKPAIAAVLLGLLLFYDPNSAQAASGGRIGGNSFSSRSRSSSSSSSSSQTYSVPRTSNPSFSSQSSSSSSSQTDSVPRTSNPSFSSQSWSSSSSQTYSVPQTSNPSFSYSAQTAPYYGPSPSGEGFAEFLSFSLALVVILVVFNAFVSVSGFRSDQSQDDSILNDTQKTSVIKLQVGLLGLGRTLQQDFNRLAESADTSTPEGLSYVLTEAALALLRHMDYCISCYSSVDVKPSIEKGEKRFNQLSIEERGKFDEETLVNVNSIKRQSSKIQKARGFSNEYIVVTILVAAEGIHKLKPINGSVDLKEALLKKLGPIPRNKIMAVEVLWTPQNENDALSERELLEDYPLLRPL